MDGYIGRVWERQRKDRARSRIGHEQSSQTSEKPQQHAFRQHLADQLAPRRAERHADRRLRLFRYAPRQQQVRHVGACHQQHQSRDEHQQLESLARLLLHVLNPRASRGDDHVLLWNFRGRAVAREGFLRSEPRP